MEAETLKEANNLVSQIKAREEELGKAKGDLRLCRVLPLGNMEYLYYVRPETMKAIQMLAVASLESDLAAMKARLAEL